MPSKRVLFLGAFVALAASGADARALLQEPGAVAADPADLACGACKKFVAEGEEYINDPSTLDQVGEEIKKLCEDQAVEQAEMVRSVREARARGTRSIRARDPRRLTTDGVASDPTSPRKTTTERFFLLSHGVPRLPNEREDKKRAFFRARLESRSRAKTSFRFRFRFAPQQKALFADKFTPLAFLYEHETPVRAPDGGCRGVRARRRER